MERETPSDNVANSIVAARPWLTLERLLEVLPLKKSYIHYRNAYATDSSDAHRATAAVRLRLHCCSARERTGEDASDLPRQR
jgi:hypothetical protein